jgi:ABC-type transport system involved in multi-copper enzyme maturation permease subunit
MNRWRDVVAIAGTDLRRTGASAKGLVLLMLYGLLQTVGGVLFAVVQRSAVGEILWSGLLSLMGGGEPTMTSFLGAIPRPILWNYWFTQFVLPMLVLLMGFDQISGELSTKSIRYVAYRAERSTVVLGKALAQAGALFGLSLLSNLVVLGFSAVLVPGLDPFFALKWALWLWMLSSAYGLAYVAGVTFVSACFRTPFLSLGVGAGALFVTWLVGLWARFDDRVEFLKYLLPSHYASGLLAPVLEPTVYGLVVLLGFTAVFVGAAVAVLRARDL